MSGLGCDCKGDFVTVVSVSFTQPSARASISFTQPSAHARVSVSFTQPVVVCRLSHFFRSRRRRRNLARPGPRSTAWGSGPGHGHAFSDGHKGAAQCSSVVGFMARCQCQASAPTLGRRPQLAASVEQVSRHLVDTCNKHPASVTTLGRHLQQV